MSMTKHQMTSVVKEQILKVRDTAEANMFDINAVISIANRENWLELVAYLSDKKNQKAYNHFILNGETKPDEKM